MNINEKDRRRTMRLIIISLMILLCACTKTVYVDKIKYVQVNRPALQITPPPALKLKPVSIKLKDESGELSAVLGKEQYVNFIYNNTLIADYIKGSIDRITQCEAYYTSEPEERPKEQK